MKRGQANIMFVYIITGIISVMILVFGYSAITHIKKSEGTINKFKIESDLRNDVAVVSPQYKKIVQNSYFVGDEIQEVCFYDKSPVDRGDAIFSPEVCNDNGNPILQDLTKDTDNNVLIFTDKIPKSFKIDNLGIAWCNYYCKKTKNGKIELRLEGRGNAALVS